MTTEKALELLNDMEFSEKYQGVQEYAEMLMVCKEALEKQIPKKPKNYLVNIYCQDYLCPNCRIKIISKIDGEFIAGKIAKYCDNCGQALEWREIF